MTDPSPFARLAALYSRGPSNGASTNSLDLALSRVAVAEKNLEEARSAARVAARRAGVSGSYLFEATSFIPRSTGHRWRDEALEQGKAERTQLLIRVAEAVRNPDPRFAGVGEALRRGMERGAFSAIIGETTSTADDVDDDAEAAARVEAEAKAKAEAILAAAALRDAGGPPMPKPGPKAQKILDAGTARRRPFGD